MIERISDDIFEFLLFVSTFIIRLTYIILKIIVAIICGIIYALYLLLIELIKNNYTELILLISIILILYVKFKVYKNNTTHDLNFIIKQINKIDQRQQKVKFEEQQLIQEENDLINLHREQRITKSIKENLLISQESEYIDKLINDYKLSNIIDKFIECPICKDDKLEIEIKTLKCHSTHQFCRNCIMKIDKCPLCNLPII